MAQDKIVLDRDSFKALSRGTRVSMLKCLLSRRKTASEVAAEMGIAVQTASEHLNRLEDAGLVARVDGGRKWVYFELTGKGRGVVAPEGRAFFVLLGLSIFCFAAAFWRTIITPLTSISPSAGVMAPVAAGAAAQGAPMAARTVVQAAAPQATAIAAPILAAGSSASMFYGLTSLEIALAAAGFMLLLAAVYLRIKNARN